MTAPLYDQDSFRFRDDNYGLNVDNGWLAILNDDYWPGADTVFRLRFVIQEYNNKSANNIDFRIRQNVDGIGYGDVSAASTSLSPVYLTNDSQGIADHATTTQLIGSGTYGTGDSEGFDDGTTDVNTGPCDFSGNDEIEVEFCLAVDSAYISGVGYIDLQVTLSDNSPLDNYTNTPRLTIPTAARRVFITHASG